MSSLGWPEIALIIVVVVLLFGAKRLPEIGKSLGRGIKEFRGGLKGLSDDVKEGMDKDEKPSGSSSKPSDDAGKTGT